MSPLDSVRVSGLLIAQESVTSTTVKWFIVALLTVAVLLTVLTVWYWKRTDPRRRAVSARHAPVARADAPRTAAPVATAGAAGPVGAPANSVTRHPDAVWGEHHTPSAADAANDARRRAQTAGQAMPASPPPTSEDLEADDWLRLTGPQALPRDRT